MTTETLGRLIHASPFVPPAIKTADNREVGGPNREFIAPAVPQEVR
jgi:hypothetical protein